MADEKMMRDARQVYETMCGMLDAKGCTYEKNDEEMTAKFGVSGEDIPMQLFLAVDPEKQLLKILSRMPFSVPAEKRVDLAMAINIANYGMINGSFDYDLGDGNIYYRIAMPFRGSLLEEKCSEYLVALAIQTIDKYNDRFMMLSKGLIDLAKFLQLENEDRNH